MNVKTTLKEERIPKQTLVTIVIVVVTEQAATSYTCRALRTTSALSLYARWERTFD